MITILQPAFMPWLGYLAMIKVSRSFVLYDDVQFFRWFVNRNKIKVNGQEKWITVPVKSHRDLIKETKIDYSKDWMGQHLETIRHAYAKAENFKEGYELVKEIYYKKFDTISKLAAHSISTLCGYLDIKTTLILSSLMGVSGRNKSERLARICSHLHASIYLTGFGSDDYIDANEFNLRSVRLVYYKYEETPRRQIGETFLPYMSSIDAIMNHSREEVKKMIDKKMVLTLQSELK